MRLSRSDTTLICLRLAEQLDSEGKTQETKGVLSVAHDMDRHATRFMFEDQCDSEGALVYALCQAVSSLATDDAVVNGIVMAFRELSEHFCMKAKEVRQT